MSAVFVPPLLVLLFGCPSACRHGESSPTIDIDIDIPEAQSTSDPLISVREGSTEIWSGGKMVGVAYREAGEPTEHIYMFLEDVGGQGDGSDPHDPTTGIYSALLGPHPVPLLGGAPMGHQIRALQKCQDQQCWTCDQVAQPCFSDHTAFAHPDTGVWSILEDRMGTTTPADLENISHHYGVGSIGAKVPFTEAECTQRVRAIQAQPSHVDKVMRNGLVRGFAWVADMTRNGTTAQEQVVIMYDPVAGIGSGAFHVNDGIPADQDTPADGSADEWCSALVAPCNQLNCHISNVSFTYP